MNIYAMESIGAVLIVLGIAAWIIARRNQKSNAKWNDQIIIALSGFVTIALITGLTMVLDGAM